MTPEQFTQWLLGFAELSPKGPDTDQWTLIKKRLNETFENRSARTFAFADMIEDSVVKNVGSVSHDHVDNRPLKSFKPVQDA